MNQPDPLNDSSTDELAAADPSERVGAGAVGKGRGILQRVSSIPTPLIFAGSILIAVLLLLWEGALNDVGPAIRGADTTTIIAGLLLYLAGLALLCIRWHVLVRMIKGVSHAPRAAEAFLTSVVINYAAPVSLAVPSRVALTKRALGLTAAETGAVALWEIASDVLVLGIASLLWFIIGGRDADLIPEASNGLFLIIGLLIVAAILGVGLLLGLARFKPQLWARGVKTLRTTATYPARRPAEAALAVVISAIYWIAQGAVLWLLLEALGEHATTPLVLGLISLPILVGMLSPVPGGAGVREALMLAIARVHDADGATVLLAAVTYRIALFASIPILYGLVRIWLKLDPAPALPPESAASANLDPT